MRRSQWLMSVDFPSPAQATIVTMLISLFAQARSRKAISSSRPKISLPVMGNLATEIFLGPGLAGRLRTTADDLGGRILCKLWRVILRLAAICPVSIGITDSRSDGV